MNLVPIYGAYGDKSPDVTGWAIAALAFYNTGQLNSQEITNSINKSVNYVSMQTQNQDGGWCIVTYGQVNCHSASSVASVLFGLIEYDADGVKNGDYNNNVTYKSL